MLLKLSKIVLGIVAAISLANCSSSSSSSSQGVFAAAQSALESAAPSVDATAIYLDPFALIGSRASVAPALVDDDAFSDPDGNSFTNNLMEYVEKMYGDENDNSVFARASSPFLIVCTLDALAAKTGGVINNGTQTVTIRVSQLSACGSADDYQGGAGSLDGAVITFVVSTPADTTNYDSYIIMDGATNPIFGGGDQYMYIRKTNTTLNFAHYEVDNTAAPTSVSASWLSWNILTTSGTFQYISRNNNVENLFRIAYDVSGNDARVFTYVNVLAGPTIMTTSAASTALNQTQAAFSFDWSGQFGAPGTDTTDANGCINIAGLATLQTDDSLTCAGNSKTVAAASTAAPIITKAMSTLSIANIAAYGSVSATGDNMLPDFDGADITTSVTGW